MANPTSRSNVFGEHSLGIIADYNPKEEKRIEFTSFEEFVRKSSFPEKAPETKDFASRIEPFPKMSEMEHSFRDSGIVDLSHSLVALRKEDWSPEELAESLLQSEEIRQKFHDKEELVAILSDLKKLDTDLQKVGCSSLHQFLEKLFPQKGENPDAIESEWVPIRSEPSRTQRPSYVWSLVKKSYHFAQQVAEVKGVVSSMIALYVLLRDPRTKALIRGLKWLVFAVV